MKIHITPNRVIKYLVLSDLAFWTGWGLMSPIFAIFIVERIEGGSALVVGIASAIYWISKALFRIPVGLFLDTFPSERDDYFVLVLGLLIAALTPFGFIFAKIPLHIYILQAFYALGIAMSLSGWSAIFTRHIDKGKEATEWGLDATAVGIGIGVAGAVGGWTVSNFGFKPVFLAVGILGLLGVVVLFSLRKDIKGVFEKDSLSNGFHSYFKNLFHREKERK